MPVFLIVEPSSFVRSSMRQWLEEALAGCRILVAGTAEEALQIAAQEQPTHILIETYLPDTPGLGLLQKMRQSLPAARIIATHWYESRRFLASVRTAGAHDFISKHRLHAELLPLLESGL